MMSAIAVFAGHLHTAGQAGNRFEPVTGHQTGMVGSAAGHDLHRLDGFQQLLCTQPETVRQHPAAGDASFQGIGNGPGLLIDLLEHIVAIFTPFHRIHRQTGFLDRALHTLAVPVVDDDAETADLGDVPLFQEQELLRHRQQGEYIGGDEVLTYAQTDHQRTAMAGGDQTVGFLFTDHPQGIGPVQGPGGIAYRGQQIHPGLELVVDSMHDDFGIGLGGEAVAGLSLRLPQDLVIFDDAVVHDRHVLLADVRVGITHRRFTMGRPTGMGDTDLAW